MYLKRTSRRSGVCLRQMINKGVLVLRWAFYVLVLVLVALASFLMRNYNGSKLLNFSGVTGAIITKVSSIWHRKLPIFKAA